jgi:hypothetical protein
MSWLLKGCKKLSGCGEYFFLFYMIFSQLGRLIRTMLFKEGVGLIQWAEQRNPMVKEQL